MSSLFVRACLLLLLVAAWQGLHVRAQAVQGGVRGAALGHATTALAGALFAENPAARGPMPARRIGLYAAQPFGLRELRTGVARLAVPTRLGTLTVGGGTFGFSDYRETHLDLEVARGFHVGTTRWFYAGLGVRYQHVAIAGYGSAGAVGLSAGTLVRLLPTVHVGMLASNLNGPRLAGREVLPRSLAAGLAYRPSDALLILLDVTKDLLFPLSTRAGVEFEPLPALAFRTGIATAPTRFTLGAGFRAGPIEADLAAERHDVLGWSPSASLGVRW